MPRCTHAQLLLLLSCSQAPQAEPLAFTTTSKDTESMYLRAASKSITVWCSAVGILHRFIKSLAKDFDASSCAAPLLGPKTSKDWYVHCPLHAACRSPRLPASALTLPPPGLHDVADKSGWDQWNPGLRFADPHSRWVRQMVQLDHKSCQCHHCPKPQTRHWPRCFC